MTPLLAFVLPLLAASPAAAVPSCDTLQPYAARASADVAQLIGLPAGPVADVRLASTVSGLVTGSGVGSRSAAAARDLSAGKTVHQQAPPAHPGPAAATTARRDHGVLSVGAGTLRARAKPVSCDAGPSAHSSAAVLDATVLPGAPVRVLGTMASQTATGLIRHDGGVAAGAGASVSLGDLRLFAGSRSEIAVRVVRSPTLQVATSGSAPVKYTSPILEISGPGLPSRRLDEPGTAVDLGIPRDLTDSLSETSDLRSGKKAAPLGLPGLPDISGLPPLAALRSPSAPAASGSLAVLRLSLGDLRQAVSDQGVRASAASLRLQVFVGGATVVDLGIGLLQAAATAPSPMGTTSPAPTRAGGDGGSLPITGVNVGGVVVLGALLFVAGRLLTVLARRLDPRGPARSGRAGPRVVQVVITRSDESGPEPATNARHRR